MSINKIKLIKTEIDRLQSSTLDENSNFKSQYDQGIFDGLSIIDNFIDSLEEDPVSNYLEEAAYNFVMNNFGNPKEPPYKFDQRCFKAGAQWQKANLWKDAQGDDLPEIDREVIVLVKSLPEYEDSLLKVSIAHIPPEYWMGKNIGTGEITRYEPKRYDKGGWNQPDVVYWLDVELPKEEE